MTAFGSNQPILRRKQQDLDVQDLEGLLRIELKLKNLTLFSGFYTRIDQVFLLWGAIVGTIFFTAQFLPLNWTNQAVLWSILTIVGAWGTVRLAWYWVTVEELRWVVYLWTFLMIVGVTVTNWGIFGGWWAVLPHLCSIWLLLSTIGYLGTAWGLRSRAFLGNGLLHLGAMFVLPYTSSWQFLLTGMVTAGTLLLLAEVQWDMNSTSNYRWLTAEQKQFNRQQRWKREVS
jgi:hypothetical protein